MKILFTPYGGGSIAHIVRSLAIAEVLRDRGHEVLFTAPATKRTLIEQAGFEIFGSGHPEVNLNDQRDQSIKYFHTHRSDFLAWLQDEIDAASSFRPHVIVNSPTFFGAQAAEKLSIPHISLINGQWLTEYQGILGVSLATTRLHHQVLRQVARPLFRRRFEQVYLQEIKSFYRSLEIERMPNTQAELHAKHPVIIPSIPEIEPVNLEVRNDIHYVGPLMWKGFEEYELDIPKLYPDLSKKPFVYVSLGGSIFRKESYEELIVALSKKSEWNILFTIGPNFPREAFICDSPNIKIRNFASGLRACEFADIVINTASHGTVMQALTQGKPIVAVPHNIDQATIAARLTELKLGVNLNKIKLRDFTNREHYFEKATRVSPETIIAATQLALQNRSLKDNAQKMKQRLRSYGNGEEKAADIVEQHADRIGYREARTAYSFS